MNTMNMLQTDDEEFSEKIANKSIMKLRKEFTEMKELLEKTSAQTEELKVIVQSERKANLIYGLPGIQKFCGCGKTKACEISNNPKYADAIYKDGALIIVDGDLLLELMKKK